MMDFLLFFLAHKDVLVFEVFSQYESDIIDILFCQRMVWQRMVLQLNSTLRDVVPPTNTKDPRSDFLSFS